MVGNRDTVIGKLLAISMHFPMDKRCTLTGGIVAYSVSRCVGQVGVNALYHLRKDKRKRECQPCALSFKYVDQLSLFLFMCSGGPADHIGVLWWW